MILYHPSYHHDYKPLFSFELHTPDEGSLAETSCRANYIISVERSIPMMLIEV